MVREKAVTVESLTVIVQAAMQIAQEQHCSVTEAVNQLVDSWAETGYTPSEGAPAPIRPSLESILGIYDVLRSTGRLPEISAESVGVAITKEIENMQRLRTKTLERVKGR